MVIMGLLVASLIKTLLEGVVFSFSDDRFITAP